MGRREGGGYDIHQVKNIWQRVKNRKFWLVCRNRTDLNCCQWLLDSILFPFQSRMFFFQVSKNSFQKQYYCQKLSKCEHSGSKLAAKLIIAMLQPSATTMASNCHHASEKQDLDQDHHFCPCCLTQLL